VLSPPGFKGENNVQLIYRNNFVFSAEDVRKNILLPFRTERDFDRLVIRLKYGPKAIRDPAIINPQIEKCVRTYFPPDQQLTDEDRKEYDQLLNFVTLSLDHDGAYVGCAHRHPPQQTIVLSSSGSSWGFEPTAASAGSWRIVLHVQAVVAGTVDYALAVCGLEEGESDACIPAL
jgi:hypothetical protein